MEISGSQEMANCLLNIFLTIPSHLHEKTRAADLPGIMYQVACKAEYQPPNRSISQLTSYSAFIQNKVLAESLTTSST